MKFNKSVISIAFGLSALASTTVSAFTENLEFNGVILDSIPVWEWEVDSDAKIGARDLILDITTGTLNGSNIEWDMPKFYNQMILKGHLAGVLSFGIPGMEPTVSFNGVDVTGATDDDVIEVVLDAYGNNSKNGKITLEITGNGHIKYIEEVRGNLVRSSPTGGNERVGAWTKSKVDETRPTIESEGLVFALYVPASTFWLPLNDIDSSTLTAAVGFASQNAKLSFPSSRVPNVWAATLPITITLQ